MSIPFFSETSKYLVDLLTPLQTEEQQAWLERIVDAIQKQNLKSTTVEKHDAEKAAKVTFCNSKHPAFQLI